MRILFDLRNVGLGNNGGSLTLIKSGNALQDLGHEVYFIDGGKNKHTWVQLECEHIVVDNNDDVPSADIIIATGYRSVAKTIKSPDRCGLKCHWIRGWETWQFPPKKIVSKILEAPTVKLVNSLGLKQMLKDYNFKSKIIHPGYDLEELYPTGARSNNKSFVVGGLYTSGKHEHIKRTTWVIEVYKRLKRKYKDVDLWMFGNSIAPQGMAENFIHRPTPDAKQYFYNTVDLWLSPAIQEGLHMPPAEAMMTECPVVGVSAKLSGTHDYLIDNITGLVSRNDIEDFFMKAEQLYLDKEMRLEMGKRARQKIEEIGDRRKNMKHMIKYLSGLM